MIRDYPRAFVLVRDTDVTGVSGTGVVAQGVEFGDGVVALRWTSDWPTSVVFHERGIESVEAVHGHGGATPDRVAMTPDPQALATEVLSDADRMFEEGDVPCCQNCADAPALAAQVQADAARIAAALALHADQGPAFDHYCDHCNEPWPCVTVRALTGGPS